MKLYNYSLNPKLQGLGSGPLSLGMRLEAILVPLSLGTRLEAILVPLSLGTRLEAVPGTRS